MLTVLRERQEGWGLEFEGESGMGRSSRGSRCPEAAESASQNARFASKSEPLKGLGRAGTWSELHLGKKTLTAVWTIQLIQSRARTGAQTSLGLKSEPIPLHQADSCR